jgi:hypothetical protein
MVDNDEGCGQVVGRKAYSKKKLPHGLLYGDQHHPILSGDPVVAVTGMFVL